MGCPSECSLGQGCSPRRSDHAPDVFRNHVMEAMACSYGVQLIAAVSAYSWLQSRHAVGNSAVASYAARGMSGRAVAACSCVLRRTRFDFTLAS